MPELSLGAHEGRGVKNCLVRRGYDMEKRLAIVSGDVVYSKSLEYFFNESKLIGYKVDVFFDWASYLEFRDYEDVRVLVIDENLLREAPELDEKVIVLSEERVSRQGYVFKYQALDVIVKEVNFLLHESENLAEGGLNKIRTFSVGGNRGGSGASTFALCLSEILGRKENTLFLCLDPFLDLPKDMEKSGAGLSELIYSLKVHGNLWMKLCDKFVTHGRDFDYIAGCLSFSDLSDFDENAMRAFFAGLSVDGRYKNVVVDLGKFPKGALVAVEKSEGVFITGTAESSIVKKQLVGSYGENLEGKCIELMIPPDEKMATGHMDSHDFENSETVTIFIDDLNIC